MCKLTNAELQNFTRARIYKFPKNRTMARSDTGRFEFKWSKAPKYVLAAHKFEDIVLVYNIRDKHILTTGEIYTTICGDRWIVEVKLKKDIPFENFEIIVKIKKHPLTDRSGNPLKTDKPAEVTVLIWLYNLEGKMCSVPYYTEGSLTASSHITEIFPVDKHYSCLLGQDGMNFPRDVLVIRAQLYVEKCCDRIQTYKTRGGKYSDDKKRYDKTQVENGNILRPYGYKCEMDLT